MENKSIFEKVKEVILPNEMLAFNIIIRTDYDAKGGHGVNFSGEVTVNARNEDEALDKARQIIWKKQSDDFPVWHGNTDEPRGTVKVVETVSQIDNTVNAFLSSVKRIAINHKYFRQTKYVSVSGEEFAQETKWSSKNKETHNQNAIKSLRVMEEIDEVGNFNIRGKTYGDWDGIRWVRR